MNIVLAGMPGSGKTTVAQALKSNYGKIVYDTDAEIVSRYGRIADIFESRGEEYFRDLETSVVENLSLLDGVVIATGGGCLLRDKNVSLFKANGKIVYLRTRIETLVKRVEGDTERPLLQGDFKAKIETLFSSRSQIYLYAADIIIDTDDLTPEQIADKIIKLI